MPDRHSLHDTDKSLTMLDIPFNQVMAMMRTAEADLRRNPRNHQAMVVMAGVSAMQEDGPSAIAWLKKALALRKKDPDILRRLVSACKLAKKLPEARKYARKLCELEPRSVENHEIHGDILEQMGLADAAIEAGMKVMRLEPGKTAPINTVAYRYSIGGNHAKAREFYAMALKQDPLDPDALYGMATSGKTQAEEAPAIISAICESLERETEEKSKARLHFSAGKINEDIRDADRAFLHYRDANKLMIPETPGDLWKPFSNLKSVMTRDYFTERTDFGSDSRQPIFIVGMPRSGTTLTESICGAHSKVTAADELPIMTAIAQALERDNDSEAIFKREMERIPASGSREIAGDYLRSTADKAGNTPHFTDKMPHNFMNIGLIHLVFPKASIIHVRRHPLDNCLSLFFNAMNSFHNAYKTDLTTLGLYYRQYMQLMQHWRIVLPGRMLEIAYEDLVANTELNARRMIANIGLEWEDSVMDRTGSQRSVRTLSQWQVRQPVYKSSSGKWRSYERHLGPLIESIGPYVSEYENELAELEAGEN
ncbi:MAG: sulfotransferase [Nitratireductor sp.]